MSLLFQVKSIAPSEVRALPLDIAGGVHFFFFFKPLYIMKKHPFKDIYDKIYRIGYYSGFYSFANGGNLGLSSKNEEDS